ncbi:hypothetical protein GCM10007989_02120 [Devosia pacifica]|uniref:Uncharacterized protein n=1 Tax=Devosia pacifica TaxID=1335967 RepID=A0A918RUY5_9HYPH|nr:hypothetical protein [Devosia pacifica]GHA11390.1 hypothetical protein GCM10007989_02120 [Devosia pacifica]
MSFHSVEVVTPPEPFVVPEDIQGGTAADAAIIAAVTNSIAAPSGWLGRSLGQQTLQANLTRFCNPLHLPCGPVISITSIKYTDPDGNEATVSDETYRMVGNAVYLQPGKCWPSAAAGPDAVRVEYVAGYAANDVPAEAKQAVILGTQQLRDLSTTNVFVRSETVEGVGVTQWAIDARAGEVVRRAVSALLAGLRLYE